MFYTRISTCSRREASN